MCESYLTHPKTSRVLSHFTCSTSIIYENITYVLTDCIIFNEWFSIHFPFLMFKLERGFSLFIYFTKPNKDRFTKPPPITTCVKISTCKGCWWQSQCCVLEPWNTNKMTCRGQTMFFWSNEPHNIKDLVIVWRQPTDNDPSSW